MCLLQLGQSNAALVVQGERANQISAWWFTCETSEQCIWYGRWRSREWSNISKGVVKIILCVCYYFLTKELLEDKSPFFLECYLTLANITHGTIVATLLIDWLENCPVETLKFWAWVSVKNLNYYLSATFSGNSLANFIVVLFRKLARGSFFAWLATIKAILLVIVFVVWVLKFRVKFSIT